MPNVGVNVVLGCLCQGAFHLPAASAQLYELFEREPAPVWLLVVQRELGWTGEALINVDRSTQENLKDRAAAVPCQWH